MKVFDDWNEVKKKTNSKKVFRSFKERDIFYMHMGENIGFEQNGKGSRFVRPVIVFKKFSNDMFLGIPISSQLKEGSYFYRFDFMKKGKSGQKTSQNIAILVQVRLFSTKRLLNKIGVIEVRDYENMKGRLKRLLF